MTLDQLWLVYLGYGVIGRIVGFAANLMIRPVADRHMERQEATGRFQREKVPVTAERS